MENEKKNLQDLKSECEQFPVDLINAGEFISESEAHASLEKYFKEPGVPSPTDPDHIYGHTFGLNKIRQLMNKIDVYNKSAEEEKQVHGIRIYYGKCRRRDPKYSQKGELRDVFLMPVIKDGSDLYKVDRFFDGEFIVGEGRPCPNQCGKKINE